MSERIDFPDAEEVVRAFLDTAVTAQVDFGDVTAHGTVPAPRPKRFVRVMQTGGTEALVHTTPTLVVEGWGRDDADASRICRLAVALLKQGARDGWLGNTPCGEVDVIGLPARLPDPVTDQARYTATVAVTLRGTGA